MDPGSLDPEPALITSSVSQKTLFSEFFLGHNLLIWQKFSSCLVLSSPEGLGPLSEPVGCWIEKGKVPEMGEKLHLSELISEAVCCHERERGEGFRPPPPLALTSLLLLCSFAFLVRFHLKQGY